MQLRAPLGKATATTPSLAPTGSGVLQRKCACSGMPGPTGECDACRKKKLQRRSANLTAPSSIHYPQSLVSDVPPIVHEVLSSPGQPLDEQTRAFIEPRFGHDFSQVRVHTDAHAAESARAVNALAYTIGQDVVFDMGQYRPNSTGGLKLLAHELTHTIQQSNGTRQSISRELDEGEGTEHEANMAAQMITGGKGYRPAGSCQPHLARQPTGGSAATGGLPPTSAPTYGVTPTTPSQTPPTVPALPTVVVGHFRNSGSTADSGENNCANCPRELGVHTTDFKNGMELRGDITGDRAGAQYDFKRTREGGIWKKVAGTWIQTFHDGPGANDDRSDNDEQLTPVNNHIYAEDIPGLGSDPASGDTAATDAVLKGSFVESVNVRVGSGSWTKSSNDCEWHSVSWVEKVGGSWRRKAGSNEIAPGSATVGTGDP